MRFQIERIEFIVSPSFDTENGFCSAGRCLDSTAGATGSAEKPKRLSVSGIGLRMDRLDNRGRRRRQESVDQVGQGIGFDFVPQSPLNSVQMPNSGRLSSRANRTTSFLLVSGFGSGAYSAKLLAGTRQRFSNFL